MTTLSVIRERYNLVSALLYRTRKRTSDTAAGPGRHMACRYCRRVDVVIVEVRRKRKIWITQALPRRGNIAQLDLINMKKQAGQEIQSMQNGRSAYDPAHRK